MPDGHTHTGSGQGDLGRRVAFRREQLHLTRAELAERAGLDPGYLASLEDGPAAGPSPGSLLRLAAALETTAASLLGDEVARPPGRGRPAPHAHLDTLDENECWRLLGPGGVGRFVFLDTRGPVAVPVNYHVVEGAVVFRTAEGSSLAQVSDGESVGLEVDQIDEAMSEGWSVVASGLLEHVTDPAARDRMAADDIEPWAGDSRDAYLRFVPIEVTGRRIRAGS